MQVGAGSRAAVKGLKAEPLGVLFHHFLEMTESSRWRISGIHGNCSSSHKETLMFAGSSTAFRKHVL